MGKVNVRLVREGHVEMIIEELVAGRLYTGPMYHKYNTVLRSKSGNPFLVQQFEQLCKGNTYRTTIHAVNSCVIKLSKLTSACKVWRGFTDARLPDKFWAPNEQAPRLAARM